MGLTTFFVYIIVKKHDDWLRNGAEVAKPWTVNSFFDLNKL